MSTAGHAHALRIAARALQADAMEDLPQSSADATRGRSHQRSEAIVGALAVAGAARSARAQLLRA